MNVSRRPEMPADEPFLRRLVIDTIAEELGAQAWPEPMRTQLLGLQYQSRRAGTPPADGDTSSDIIVVDGEDAGWVLAADLASEIRIIEIMVLPCRRGQGVGSAAIASILDRAADARKPVRLTVNCVNARAIRLYERLGFRTTDSDQVQQSMEWTPKQ
jgi:ribosomal protein S18 acetylase RimI-like enzyme